MKNAPPLPQIESPHRAEFSALQTFARLSATVLDLGDALAAALDILHDIFHCHLLAIILLDDESGVPRLAATGGNHPPAGMDALMPLAEATIKREAPTAGIIAPNLPAWGIPLLFGKLTQGVLIVGNATPPATEQFFTAYANQIVAAISSAKLYETSREQQQQDLTRRQIARHLQQVATIINGTLDLDDVLKLILERVHNVIPYRRALILLLRGQQLVARATDGVDEPLANISINTTENIFYQQVLLQQYPTIFHNITENPFWKLQRAPFAADTKAWVGAPLVFKKKIIGLLSLHHNQTGYFDDADLELVHAFANQAAMAIENARLYKEEQQKVKQFHTVAKIGRQTAEINDLQTLLYTVTDRLHHDLGYEFIALFVYDINRHTLQLKAASDVTPDEIASAAYTLPLSGNGIISTAASTKEPLLVNNISAFPGYFPGPGRETVRSEVALPLLTHNGLVGVLDLQSSQPHHFSPDDITLVQTVADQLAIAVETANLNQQHHEFIHTIAHELRTPLTFLRGYVDLILEDGLGPVPPKIRNSLAIVSTRTYTLQKLVSNLVTHQKLKVSPPEFALINLPDIITLVAKSAEPTAAQSKLTIHTDIDPTIPPIIADPDQLHEVLDNLLGNAIKFTPAGGSITVTAGAGKTTVTFSITDTGIGIPQEKQGKIFQRFYRIKTPGTSHPPGTGLGLTIVKQIVDAHHGDISVESAPGKGTTFTVTLPITQPDNPF